MKSIEARADALKALLEKSSGTATSALARKAAESGSNNPTAAAFNVWHANGDIGIGSDNPWGTHGKPILACSSGRALSK